MITAVYMKPIFSAADKDTTNDNGYRVFLYKCLDVTGEDEKHLKKGKTFTAFGYYLGDIFSAVYELNGTWTSNKKYGEQYKVDNFHENITTNKRGILNFLNSPALKGIGEKTANRIYKKFGDDTLKIMDEDIDRLLEVRGISKTSLEKIRESYTMMRGAKELITTLANYDVNSNVAMKIYEQYKEKALEIVKTHPYKLQENHRIGFLTCDKIAKAFNFDMNSSERIQAAIEFALIRIETFGHCGCTQEMLLNAVKANDVLGRNFNNSLIASEIKKMIENNTIVYVRNLYFRSVTYHVECEVAERIIDIIDCYHNTIENVSDEIDNWESKSKIKLDDEQRKAIATALTSGFTVITGGAGRGKTTITKAIVKIRQGQKKNNSFCLLSPTGRAAKVLNAATSFWATTIHSRLKLRGFMEVEDIDEEIFIEDDTVIIDETSMLDLWVARNLLTSVKNGSQVIFIGDVDQLPSVRCGAVLRDIIDSGTVPVIRLMKNYRQKEDGALIVDNGDKINAGNTNLEFDHSSFMFYDMSPYQDQFEQSAKVMIALYRNAIELYGKENVIVLSPHHHADTKSSVDNMNRYLQYYVNPHNTDTQEIEYRHQTFRLGDIVIKTTNADGIANGDIGIITSVFKGNNSLSVTFSDAKREFSGDELDDLELAYAISIHKSQGSQYMCVILNLLLGHSIMLKRNLLYTAISRAQKEVHLVSTTAALEKAILTEDTNVRITLLKEKLQQLYKKRLAERNFTPVNLADTPFQT